MKPPDVLSLWRKLEARKQWQEKDQKQVLSPPSSEKTFYIINAILNNSNIKRVRKKALSLYVHCYTLCNTLLLFLGL